MIKILLEIIIEQPISMVEILWFAPIVDIKKIYKKKKDNDEEKLNEIEFVFKKGW